MRSALAKGLGLEEDAIEVDFKSKSVSIAKADVAVDAVSKALEGTKFTASSGN